MEKNNFAAVLNSHNAVLLEEIFERYNRNPQELDPSWRDFFQKAFVNGHEYLPSKVSNTLLTGEKLSYHSGEAVFSEGISDDNSLSLLGFQNLLNSYRIYGHYAADIDPLNLRHKIRDRIDHKINLLKPYTEDIFDSKLNHLGATKLQNIIDFFEKTYCGSTAVEYYHIMNDDEREWLRDRIELTSDREEFNQKQILQIFQKIAEAETLEKFLAKKYIGKKRFSIEGGESLIAQLDTLIELAADADMNNLVFGMAHRGRLNVLVNTMRKPAGLLFAEFEEKFNPSTLDYADVKYHLGHSSYIANANGKRIKLSLAFNPSHLEAVNPVILGSVRARQFLHNNDTSKAMGVLIHGDASFIGQGVVSESINLMNLEGYTTGGSLHIVVNNQIGFTTDPFESRSTRYTTDAAKGFQIPIFHVNGDDPIACCRTVKIALEYRNRFQKDVIIDLICYRRLGHNETDEPSFTQPKMYDIIRKHPTTLALFEQQLIEQKIADQDVLQKIRKSVSHELELSFKTAHEENTSMAVDTLNDQWQGISSNPLGSEPATRLLAEQIEEIGKAITHWPQDFTPHPKIQKAIEARQEMLANQKNIDWGLAEHLALGSILENGYNIRISGQDSQRGTFAHRHAVLVDVNTNQKFTPLNHISSKQAKIEVINSPLSEYAVLGFEYGYSLAYPQTLVIWEAQFGDFANGAQIIFDQFLSSSEEKWLRMSGLTVLLPHGYEGQGPEHSSARIERFLQLCANDNMQICNCTTPAQFFHLLRRQILQNFRKPLIVMTPKSLLRHPQAVSTLDELRRGKFKKIIFDPHIKSSHQIDTVLLCSGKVYYDLQKTRLEKNVDNVAVIRMEQIYPFPKNQLEVLFKMFRSNIKKVYWVQEEPRNMGAWSFVDENFPREIKKQVEFECLSRPAMASPATGFSKLHEKQQEELVHKALGLS